MSPNAEGQTWTQHMNSKFIHGKPPKHPYSLASIKSLFLQRCASPLPFLFICLIDSDTNPSCVHLAPGCSGLLRNAQNRFNSHLKHFNICLRETVRKTEIIVSQQCTAGLWQSAAASFCWWRSVEQTQGRRNRPSAKCGSVALGIRITGNFWPSFSQIGPIFTLRIINCTVFIVKKKQKTKNYSYTTSPDFYDSDKPKFVVSQNKFPPISFPSAEGKLVYIKYKNLNRRVEKTKT